MEEKREETTEMEPTLEKTVHEEIRSGVESGATAATTSAVKTTGRDEEVPPLSPITSDTTSGIDIQSDSQADTPSGTEAMPAAPVPETSTPSPADPSVPAKVSPKKKSKASTLDRIKKVISPPKKDRREDSTSPKEKKTEGRSFLARMKSKSMSPPRKPLQLSTAGEGPSAMQDDEFRKGSEKKGFGKKIKKSLSNIFKKGGSGAADSGVLVADQDDPKATTSVSSTKTASHEPEPSTSGSLENVDVLRWTEGRTSLTSGPSVCLTQVTDVPSTDSGSDVFTPDDDSRRPSDVGGGTSREAAAALASDDPVSESASEQGLRGELESPKKQADDGSDVPESEKTQAPRKSPTVEGKRAECEKESKQDEDEPKMEDS